jgi:oxygen-independent coproporphyrinogen-3 oxidase
MDLNAAPDPRQKMQIFTRTVEAFTAAGYEYVGLDHFALPDDELATARKNRTLQRNFMGYSTRAGHDLVGFGVSSIGEINGCYFQNERTLPEWGERVGRTGHGVLRGHRLSREDRLRRDVIMRVMCHGNLVKSEIEKAHGIRFDEHFARELEDLAPLEGDELLTLDADGLELTRLGQVFMRNIAVVFDLYSRERIEKGGLNDKVFSRTL